MRWDSDGVGKLGRVSFSLRNIPSSQDSLESHWVNPIKSYIRQRNQAKAVNEVLNALKPSQIDTSSQHHVVNWDEYHHCQCFGSLTTAARENVVLDLGFTLR